MRPGRRVYSRVGVAAAPGGYRITLDGRPLNTPGRRPVLLPSRALAEAVAEEWRAQGPQIAPQTMGLQRLANTAIDRVSPERGRAVETLLGYGGADLVCYRASTPDELVRRQEAAWQPLLDWVRRRYGAELAVSHSVVHVAQPEPALAALRAAVLAHGGMELAALFDATALTGSLVIALALSAAEIDLEAAWRAAELDELFQAEHWGEDEEAAARRARLRAELGDVVRFLGLLREDPADSG